VFKDPVSACIVKLILTLEPNLWAVGTGFVLSGPEGPCLATAFHNLSGGISAQARFGAHIPPRPVLVDVVYAGESVAHFMPYADGKSLFRVHKNLMTRSGDYQCDVAVMDMALLRSHITDKADDNPLWEQKGICAMHADCADAYVQGEDMFLPAGRSVLVFGFPGGRDFNGQPIAVSGSIAAHDGDTAPYLLLSGHTSAGCSGGPVVAREFGGYFRHEKECLIRHTPSAPLVDQWIGLYSGRLEPAANATANKGPQEITQVGVVWSAQTVRSVVQFGVCDRL